MKDNILETNPYKNTDHVTIIVDEDCEPLEDSIFNEWFQKYYKIQKNGEINNKNVLYSTILNNISIIPATNVKPNNSLLHIAARAYSNHLELVLSPDDIWLTINMQISKYISYHGEKLRNKFVNHKGKKILEIKTFEKNISDVNWLEMVHKFTDLIDNNIKDKKFIKLMESNFSTTRYISSTISKVSIMKSMDKYFNYIVTFWCGTPRITLKGVKNDWLKILDKISKISNLDVGDTYLKNWCFLLKQILTKFVEAYDESNRKNKQWREWWKKTVKVIYGRRGSGSTRYIEGWMSVFQGFYYTDSKGKESLYYLHRNIKNPLNSKIDVSYIQNNKVNVDIEINTLTEKLNCEFVGGIYGAILGKPNKDSKFLTIRPNIGFQLRKK